MSKAVLITGSTSGIGLGIAKRFAQAGFDVGLNSFETEAEVSSIISEVASCGSGNVVYFQADLATESGGELVSDFVNNFGRIDVLINNAGVQKVSPVDELAISDWEKIRAIGLDAAFHTIRTALPVMKTQGKGRIINIASAHALVASPYKSAYIAAKHGLLGLTKTVALEVAKQGITVNAVCPGYVMTPLVEKQVIDQARAHGISQEEVKAKIMLAPQPSGEFIEIEEVAELCFYLASDLARSITGTHISIDGGWTAQ